MTTRQKIVLSEFARNGGILVPGDDEVRERCKELTKMKLLRPQPFLDGSKAVGEKRALGVAYQVTAKGRKSSSAADRALSPAQTRGLVAD